MSDSFDPFVAHKPVPPRPTRQDVLDLLKVAEDAALEAGEKELADSIREASGPFPRGADIRVAMWIGNRLAELEMPSIQRGEDPRPLSFGTFAGIRTRWEVRAEPERQLGSDLESDAPTRFPVPFVRADGTVHVNMVGGGLPGEYVEVELVGGTVSFSAEIVPDASHVHRVIYDRRSFRLIETNRGSEAHLTGIWYQERR